MAKPYDVIIVGAGPAGLMAAKIAGENGLKTALLERKKDISKIRRSDGGGLGVNSHLFKQMLIYNPRDKRFCIPTCGFSIRYDGPIESLYGFRIYSPGGKFIALGDWKEMKKDPEKSRVGVALDKGLLLKGILNDIEEKRDVDICLGTNLTHIEKANETWRIHTDRDDFEARCVLAADGVNSRITRILGLNKHRTFMGTSRQVSITMKHVKPPDEKDGLMFILTDYGIFDILPLCRQGEFHVGAFTYDPKENLLDKIERLINEDRVYSSWFKQAEKTGEVQSCVVNLNSPLENPYHDGVLIIGDAAWVQEMGNMAALCCGWKAANAITLAFIENQLNDESFADYVQWWNDNFYKPFGHVEFGEFKFSKYLTSDDMDYLAGLIKKPLPGTLDFFQLFSELKHAYRDLIASIQEERPDVYERLLMMANARETDKAQRIQAGIRNR